MQFVTDHVECRNSGRRMDVFIDLSMQELIDQLIEQEDHGSVLEAVGKKECMEHFDLVEKGTEND